MKLTVGNINERIKNDAKTLVNEAEKVYYKRIETLAETIKGLNDCHLVLLAGPSASGKTTTAHIVCDRLIDMGVDSRVISLDNFYLPASQMPKGDDGKPDFESVYSLDIEEIHRCFNEILISGHCEMPIFDFKSSKRLGEKVDVDVRNGGIVIIEGLHALNPVLCDTLPKNSIYKIYISLTSRMYDDDGDILFYGRQLRLMRRLSRDSIYRNSDAHTTLSLWKNVLAGEEKYLYPYKPIADIHFDTFHNFEPSLFKNNILKMLESIDENSELYYFAEPLITGLDGIESIDPALIPDDSLIKEFVPGGKYENVK